MKTILFIAKRYLFARKSLNVINLITLISVIGVMVATTSMIVVMAGFNGMEKLVLEMMDSFQPDLKIEPNNKKMIFNGEIPIERLKDIEGLKEVIHRDKSGAIFKETPESLSNVILESLDEDKLKSYKQNIKKSKIKYSWSSFVKELQKL